MTPEQQARQQIDAQLLASGWAVQDYTKIDFSAGRGIALREVPLKSGTCDYLLLVDRKPVGVVEAKKEGTLLSGVAEQSGHYAANLPEFLAALLASSLPFLYESTGVETFFRDERDPEPRSRPVFSFHRPETLAGWFAEPDTVRTRLAKMPLDHPLIPSGAEGAMAGAASHMRQCQVEAITKLEKSFADAHPRALIQMATGSGKTFAACAFTYRLIKYAGARRVLFLVDRSNLGRQATAEFQQFVTPDTGRKFTELYNVQHLTSNALDPVCRVTICTTLFGIELVDSVTRLCAMNLLLHGIGGESEEDLPVVTKDALAGKHGEYEIVLANPPFGKKSSVTIVNEAGESSKESLIINRDDFWATTSNKQLNFLQHIFTILKQHGRAAVVLPDNVLFEGGAGETIRRELLKQADVHTLLRLPTGIFYAQGVKANVLSFDRKPAQEKPWTQKLWIYDLRTNLHFTLKENTLKRTDLDDFVKCYNPKNRHERKESERFKSFTYEELTKRDKVNLDIFWLKDDALEESANLPAPEVIAQEITDDLEAALEQFSTITEDLKK
jgi:hypothetical protein